MPLRVAVVGSGWVALHRHIPALRRNPAFQVTGVVDRRADRAAGVAGRLGLSFHAGAERLEDVAWLDDVDAVSIAAPPFAHAALARAAFARGKHVLLEKPFAMTAEEGESIVAAGQEARRTLGIVHNFQFGRGARRLLRDLAEGRLGRLQRLSAVQWGNPARRLPVWYEQLPLGLFFDESPHFFYLLRRLAGPLTLRRAWAVGDPDGKATPALASLLYRSEAGIPVTIACAFRSAVSEWHVSVTGDRAVGILDIFRDVYLRLPNDGAHTLPDILRTSATAMVQHLAQHVPNGLAWLRGRLDYGNDEVVARFANAALKNTGEDPEGIGGADALDVLRMQTEAVAALRVDLLPP